MNRPIYAYVCRRNPLCLQNMGSLNRHCKLFHCNGVLFDQTVVTFENILSEENKTRVLKRLQNYELPSLRKVTVSRDHRKAAVLVPLCTVKGEPSVLFMVRSNKILAHRGEVRWVYFLTYLMTYFSLQETIKTHIIFKCVQIAQLIGQLTIEIQCWAWARFESLSGVSLFLPLHLVPFHLWNWPGTL